MIKLNKTLYIALAIMCTIFALGVVVSKIVAGQTFDFASDGMLLLTTVAGWLFAKNSDDSSKSGTSDKASPKEESDEEDYDSADEDEE